MTVIVMIGINTLIIGFNGRTSFGTSYATPLPKIGVMRWPYTSSAFRLWFLELKNNADESDPIRKVNVSPTMVKLNTLPYCRSQ